MSLTTVYSVDGKPLRTLHIPSVIRNSPIRPDVVQFVHVNLSKNHRQPYARYVRAGHQHSAESWGTGRAVARVPRISGSGTSVNGAGAFANMTRGGRMFAPLKVWRRWHRLVNVNQKRFAMCSAIAASSVPALVLARGHRIEHVPEIPLVVSRDAEKIKKTKDALKLVKALHVGADIKRSQDSRKIRPGKGKMRNRRYVQRKGLLVIHNGNRGLSRAFRNISGVNCINVNRLNLRELAPGGHIGRFVLWTESAYKKLNALYGTFSRDAVLKRGYRHPKAEMTMTDIKRIITSPSVKKCLVHHKHRKPHVPRHKKHLLLTRKIRRLTILNSKAKMAHKQKLEKLRSRKLTEGQLKGRKPLPPKKAKSKKVTKRENHVDPLGRPLKMKDRVEYYKKLLEESKKKAIEGGKKRHQERVKAQIELAKKRKEQRAKSHAALLAHQKKVKEQRIQQKKATAAARKAKFADKRKAYLEKKEAAKKAEEAKKAKTEKNRAARKARKEKLKQLAKDGKKKEKKVVKGKGKKGKKQLRGKKQNKVVPKKAAAPKTEKKEQPKAAPKAEEKKN